MKDRQGRTLHVGDLVVTHWANARLVSARVISISANRCQLLIEEPDANGREVYRLGKQVAIIGEKYGPGPSE